MMDDDGSGLTAAEKQVIRSVLDAWNGWQELDGRHPADNEEICRAVHAFQNAMAFRVAQRVDPDYWWRAR